jgi:hypothetical protein
MKRKKQKIRQQWLCDQAEKKNDTKFFQKLASKHRICSDDRKQ